MKRRGIALLLCGAMLFSHMMIPTYAEEPVDYQVEESEGSADEIPELEEEELPEEAEMEAEEESFFDVSEDTSENISGDEVPEDEESVIGDETDGTESELTILSVEDEVSEDEKKSEEEIAPLSEVGLDLDADSILSISEDDPVKTVSISTAGLNVYYSFTPLVNGSYTFTSTGSLDTYGYLYSYANGETTELTSNDDGGTNTNFMITYTLSAGQEYLIRTRLFNSSSIGSYSLSVTPNGLASALSLALNVPSSGTINKEGDGVYYSFIPASSGEYCIFSSDNNGMDMYGYLYNSSKAVISSDDDGHYGTNFCLSYSLTGGQRYYVLAKALGNDETGSFSVTAMTASDYEDTFDFDDDYDDDYDDDDDDEPYLSDDHPSCDAEITTGGQIYELEYTPLVNGVYIFESSASSDTYGYLDEYANGSFSQIASDDDSGSGNNFRIVSPLLYANKTYRLRVRFYNNSVTGTIPVSVTPQIFSSSLPSLYVGSPVSCRINNIGDGVYYKFTPSFSDYYSFSTSNSNSIDVFGYLFDSNKRILTYDDDSAGSGNCKMEHYLHANQTYYVMIKSYDNTETGSFQLVASVYDNYDESVSTDVFSGAKSLVLDRDTTTAITLPGQKVYFSFKPSTSGDYYFYSKYPNNSNLSGILYESDGRNIDYDNTSTESDSSRNFMIRNYLTAGRTYYLAVSNNSGLSGNVTVTCARQPIAYTYVSNHTAKVGDRVSLSVSAVSNKALSYTWRVNGVTQSSVWNSLSLTVTQAMFNSDIQCTVSNGSDTATAAFRITASTSAAVCQHNWKDTGIQTKAPTCTAPGEKTQYCTKCDKPGTPNNKKVPIPALGHVVVTDAAIQATTAANGKTAGSHCSRCQAVLVKQQVVNKAVIQISSTTRIYNGKLNRPTVTVRDSSGAILPTSQYTISWSKRSGAVGNYRVTVTLKGRYKGSVTKSYVIKPKGTSIRGLSSKTDSVKITWKKQAKQISGYEIQVSRYRSFKNAEIFRVSKASSVSKTIRNLRGNTAYYFRIRTYKNVNESKKVSKWSGKKTIRTKTGKFQMECAVTFKNLNNAWLRIKMWYMNVNGKLKRVPREYGSCLDSSKLIRNGSAVTHVYKNNLMLTNNKEVFTLQPGEGFYIVRFVYDDVTSWVLVEQASTGKTGWVAINTASLKFTIDSNL